MTVAVVLGATFALCGLYLARTLQVERTGREAAAQSAAAGHAEPDTLHPIIDPALCIGCGSCVEACPERGVLGLVEGTARLIDPSHCIGHGACREACPMGAIELVFGTAQRGVDIPHVGPNFETNVPGVFIAGELGGMGLIRNAIEQGRQAVESIRRLDGMGDPSRLDLVIVGAGPAGIAATLAAKQHGLRAATIEQDSLGGTVAHFPRGKIVMTKPARLPIIGPFKFTETTKEDLLAFWRSVERKAALEIRYGERLLGATAGGGALEVRTSRGTYRTRALLLAIGRRGTPRKLGVPGEESSNVSYHLDDPGEFRGRRVLVVGGGDSALEAAVALAGEPATTVTLSYRSPAFSRAKDANRERVRERERAGRLRVLLESEVVAIGERHVELRKRGDTIRLDNDHVLVCAGGLLPTPLLREIGIAVDTKFGTA